MYGGGGISSYFYKVLNYKFVTDHIIYLHYLVN